MEHNYENVFFYPWVGTNYDKGLNNKKTLILGESVYCKPPDECPCGPGINAACNFQAIDIVGGQIGKKDGKVKRHRFYTKIAKLLTGLQYSYLSNEKNMEFWESVAFYEFIQKSVGTEARERPTGEMWNNSRQPFLEVIEKLRPDIILITGKELSEHLHSFEGKWELDSFEKFEGKAFAKYGKLIHNDLKIDTVSIYHPSSFQFNYIVTDFVATNLNIK